MEVPRVLRLSESLNKSKVQHMIFTLDGNTFKSFGDELSMKVLRQNGEVGKKIEEILRESEQLKRVEEAKNPDGEENVSTASDVRLIEENVGTAKGISKLRSQCTAFLQLHGFGHKDKKKKYGQGNCPPGWPIPLDWSSFKGPGKHSGTMCTEIILGIKEHQKKVNDGQEHLGRGDIGQDDLVVGDPGVDDLRQGVLGQEDQEPGADILGNLGQDDQGVDDLGVNEGEVPAIENAEFLYEAAVEDNDGNLAREQELELRLSEDENEVGDVGGQENDNNVLIEDENEVDDLPDPEPASPRPAVVQVIVQRKARKWRAQAARTPRPKRIKITPAKFL